MKNKEMLESSKVSLEKVWKQALLVLAVLTVLGVLLYSLTAAWYSNVAETTEMVFETESWGFEGQVKVLSSDLQLAPGQNTCAEISVTNDGRQINLITVSVDKSTMSPELQKRIYFYVPAAETRSEETVERVYLTPYGGYSYRVMPKSTLLLTANSAADAPVRCQWVYDLLGYYVYGTLNKDNTLLTAEDITAAKREDITAPAYIRPVEYDFDKAAFDKDGKLETADGETAASFVQGVLAADGYPDSQVKQYGEYYAVSILEEKDGEKTGLWLYLCTRQEIEAATGFDTRVGTYRYLTSAKGEDGSPLALTEEQQAEYKDVAGLTYQATIQIAGQNLRMDLTDVTNEAQLREKLESGGSVRLTEDMTLDTALEIPADKDVVIDLNGKKITAAVTEQPVLTGAPGSSVTVLNGTIGGIGREKAVELVGSRAAFSRVTLLGGLYIDDGNIANADSRTSVVRLSNCTLQTTGDNQPGITVLGNGTSASSPTVLLVEKSAVESAYVGIVGSDAAEKSGTDIQLMGSTVKGARAGIYHPQQDSRLTVQDGSTLEGETGIVVKGGRVNVLDSAVHAVLTTGSRPTEAQLAQSGGWHNAGAGIYVEATGDRAEEIVLRVVNAQITTKTADMPSILLAGKSAETVRANSDFTQAGSGITIG